MSHEITATDHMFSARGETPWHVLGTVVPGQVTRAADAIELAKLDWPVDTVPVQALHNGATLPAPMSRALVRRDTATVLATVGTGYNVLQNRDAFAAFDPWAQDGLITYETAGSLFGGKRVWILASVGGADAEIGRGDTVRTFVLLSNSHGSAAGGKRSVTVKATSVRVVCANTLHWATHDGAASQSIRHDGGVVAGVADAVAAVESIRAAAAKQAEIFRALAATPVPETEHGHADAALDYLAAVYREESSELATDKRAQAIYMLFAGNGAGSQLATAAGTYWGLYNALTDYVTHTARSRGGSEGRIASTQWGTGADTLRRGAAVAWAMGPEGIEPAKLATMDTATIESVIAAQYG